MVYRLGNAGGTMETGRTQGTLISLKARKNGISNRWSHVCIRPRWNAREPVEMKTVLNSPVYRITPYFDPLDMQGAYYQRSVVIDWQSYFAIWKQRIRRYCSCRKDKGTYFLQNLDVISKIRYVGHARYLNIEITGNHQELKFCCLFLNTILPLAYFWCSEASCSQPC
jgi:hypothetical protein